MFKQLTEVTMKANSVSLVIAVGLIALASPVHASVQNCGELFSPKSASARNEAKPASEFSPTSLRSPAEIRAILSKISTPAMAISFWKAMLAELQHNGTSEIMTFLVMTDFNGHLVNLKSHFTPYESVEIINILENIEAINQYTRKFVGPALFIFKPNVQRVIDQFNEYKYNGYPSMLDKHPFAAQEFNYGTPSALGSLPDQTKQDLKKHYRMLYNKLRRSGDPDKIPRRNVELIDRAFYEQEFQQLLTSLRSFKKIKVDELTKLVNDFWTQTGWKKYNFSAVIEIAHRIQSGPLQQYLLVEPVFLYGSFPNGKAKFPSSDIDVHLGPNLQERYVTMFDPDRSGGTFAVSAGHQSAESNKLSAAFMGTEKLIADNLGLTNPLNPFHRYTKGKLLTIVTEKPMWDDRDPFRPEVISMYNPFTIEIGADYFRFHTYDAFSTRSEIVIEVVE